MFLIRNSPQPRGFCSPSSFASRSGVSASAISRSPPWSVMRTSSSPPARRIADLDRQLGVRLVAVLDRVHHGFGDGGLEPLEARRLEAERRDGFGHALARAALVALLARNRERDVEEAGRRDVRAAVGAGQRDERDVVLLLPARAA